MPRSLPTIIVGGGITGLAAAYYLERSTTAPIVLLEESARLGGKIRTRSYDGFCIEEGPDCFFTPKRDGIRLIEDLGLTDRLVEPLRREFKILTGGRLHTVPRGLTNLAAVTPDAIKEAGFLSDQGKGLALDRKDVDFQGDTSIAEFFRARYGEEFSKKVAEPLLAGTHAGDPTRLSLSALYPAYLKPTEDTLASGKAPFVSFRTGMQELVDSLVGGLRRTRIGCSSAVVRLGNSAGTLSLVTDDEEISAEAVILTTPAYVTSKIACGISAEAASLLDSIEYASSAVVTLGYNRKEIKSELDGTGFLVAQGEEARGITGSTWSSRKWPDRTPEGTDLIRVFLVPGSSGKEMIERTRSVIEPLIGITGEPVHHTVKKWDRALPQYTIGHRERVGALRAILDSKRIYLAGAAYGGAGIPDCIRQGREIAEQLAGVAV